MAGEATEKLIDEALHNTRAYVEDCYTGYLNSGDSVEQAREKTGQLVQKLANEEQSIVADGNHRIDLIKTLGQPPQSFPARIVFPSSLVDFINISHGI